MSKEKKKVVKIIDHPLEEFFDIESKSTEIEVFQRDQELIPHADYDEKDKEIEHQFEEIYDSAMDGFELMAEEMQKVEGRYMARMGEVSVQHLNVALNAASSKAKLKEHKDKLEKSNSKGTSSKVVNNTLIVDDRSALLDQLRKTFAGEKNEQ
jgi:hypothetical protein